MSKIFFEFSGGLGPLIRCLPIAERLRERGHDITYFGHQECRHYMDIYGYRHIELDVVKPSAYNIVKKYNWVYADEFWSSLGFSNIEFLESEISKWIQKLRAYNPDVIVSDIGVFSSIVARILEIPLATITQSCYHPNSKYKPQRYWDIHRDDSMDALTAINYILCSYGASKIDCFEELFNGDITIVPSFPEFDILEADKVCNSKTHYVGPILWKGFKEHEKSIYRRKNKIHVFCYGGQLFDYAGVMNKNFFEMILSSFCDKDIEVLVAVGDKNSVNQLKIRGKYKNVKFVDWVPIDVAYSNSDLVVCHGGHGSCMGLFKYMVPGIILPTHTEREYNARALERLGVGISIPIEKFSKDLIENSVVTLLESKRCRDRLKYYNEVISNRYIDGDIMAANYILSLL